MERREGYYQGILQLRDPNDEVIDFIRNDIRKQPEVFIAKSPKVKGGIDFYLSDKKYLSILGKKLLKRFGGDLKSSVKLFSRDRQTSKNVYRLNVYFRPSPFKKGEIVTYNNKLLQIVSCSKKIIAKDLKLNKNYVFRFDEKIERVEPIYKTIVSKVKPSIEVIDPETYQSVITKNQKPVKSGEKVKIIKFKDEIWLV